MPNYRSPSQINMYLRCPAQWRFRYIDGIKLPPKGVMTKGKAVHAGQEHNYKQKMDSFSDVPLAEVQEMTAATFEAYEAETQWDKDEKPGKVKDEAISLASLYHQEVAPVIQPIAVEQEFTVKFETGPDLFGIIDLVDSRGNIRDTKTTGKTPNGAEAEKSLQLTAYALAYRTLTGEEEAGVKLDYLVQTKTPKVVTLESSRSQQDINFLVNVISRINMAIDAEAFYPNPTNFMCSEKNCGYYWICKREYGI